jgi:hypothetical protein
MSIEILVFAILVLGTALVLRPAQELMRRRMAELRDLMLARGEEFLGREIEYASIGPSIFGTLDIRNIRIRREGRSPVLSVSRLRLSYSLGELLRGNVAESLRSIRIDRPLLSFSMEEDGDLLDLFAPAGASGKGRSPGETVLRIAALLPENLRLSIRNGTGEWEAGGLLARVDGLGFDAAIRGGRVNFQGRWNAGLSFTPLARIAEARMAGRISGDCSADLSEGSANLSVPSLRGDLFRVRPLTVKLSLGENVLEIRKINDRVPFDVSLDYDLNSRQLAGSFRCDNFLLRDILSLGGAWGAYDHWLATRVSGGMTMEKEGKEAIYSLDLSGLRDARAGAGGASFAVAGRGDRSRIVFSKFSLSLPEGDFGFQGRIGFQPFSPNGYLSIANLSLTGDRAFHAGFNIAGRGREISLFGENVESGTVSLSALDLALIPENRGLSFELSALRFKDIESYEAVRLSRLSLDGSFDYGGGGSGSGRAAFNGGGGGTGGGLTRSGSGGGGRAALNGGGGGTEGGLTRSGSGGAAPGETAPANITGTMKGGSAAAAAAAAAAVQGSLLLEAFSARDLVELLRPFVKLPEIPAPAGGLAEGISLTTEVFVTTDFEQVLYNAPRFIMVYEGGGRDLVALASLSGTNRRFELAGGRVSWGGGGAELAGRADFSDFDAVSFSLTCSYLDFFYELEGMVLDRHSLSVRGSYGLQVFIGAAGPGAYSGYAAAQEILLPYREGVARLSFYSSLTFEPGRFWSAGINRFELADIATPGSSLAVLRFSGEVNQDGAFLEDIYFDDGRGVLRGALEAARAPGGFAGRANLDNPGRMERYGLEFFYGEPGGVSGGTAPAGAAAAASGETAPTDTGATIKSGSAAAASGETAPAGTAAAASGGTAPADTGATIKGGSAAAAAAAAAAARRLSLGLEGTNVQLGRFWKNSYNAVASGNLRAVWDFPGGGGGGAGEPSVRLRLESLSARVRDLDFRASAEAVLEGGEFLLRDLRVNYGGLEALMPRFRVDRREGRGDTEARIEGSLAGRELALAFTAEAEFRPLDSWFKLPRLLESVDGFLRVSEARFDTLRGEEPFSFHFSRSGSQVSLSGGPRDMIRFSLSEGGDFYAGLSNPSPVRGSVIGTLGPQTIEAQTQDLYVDMGALWRFIPAAAQEEFSFAGGYATASLRVSGPRGDPEFFGAVRGTSLRMRVPNYLREEIRPVPLTITLEGNEAGFGPVNAVVGSGMGMVSGWCRFERWIPGTFSIDIAVPPESPIPVGFDVGGVVTEGMASGGLLLSLSDMVFSASGDITAQETEISLNTEEFSGPRDPPGPPKRISSVLDFNIRAGRRVEFLWPSTGIPVIQAYADLGSSIRVSGDTLSRRYSLEGDVRLRGGEIFYVERSFYIREGLLSFRETEARFDPRISARAEIRDRTNSGPVTISMIVDNEPLRSFTARFESAPPLSQVEIFSLLGQSIAGAPVEDEEGRVTTSFVSSTVDLLVQFTAIRRVERRIREFFLLDMFSIRTQVLQNAVLQATGLQDPVDRIDGVGNYFDNTTVFLGKYFGPDMFTQFMLSLRYDEKKTSFGGLTLEPDIGIELHSPLFDIRWNFVPLHPENMYINDQSFTLTWRWSF